MLPLMDIEKSAWPAEPGFDGAVVLAVDAPADSGFRREYYVCRGAGPEAAPRRWEPAEPFPWEGDRPPAKVFVALFPTRTYAEGLGGDHPADLAPEDRGVIRSLRRRFGDRVVCGLASERDAGPSPAEPSGPAPWLEFDARYLADMGRIFRGCMTRPNRQDYMYLATKTFGLNLAVRLAFVTQGVTRGDLPLLRAVLSTSWYQLQDAVFTVFGQTYMKFLGKMTGMIRVRGAHLGDLAFVYVQLCAFEFLNRLVLGPLGENPLVYTWSGIGLIFVNILQGMASGGPLIPAINQMRKAGVISHSTMMHLYQLASLAMHFGLFATFGYQTFYAVLTGAVLVLSWSSYVLFSTCLKDPEFVRIGKDALAALSSKAARAAGPLRFPPSAGLMGSPGAAGPA